MQAEVCFPSSTFLLSPPFSFLLNSMYVSFFSFLVLIQMLLALYFFNTMLSLQFGMNFVGPLENFLWNLGYCQEKISLQAA